MEGILSLNSIKEIFSSLGAKTSDSNYAVALLDKTSAEPKGMMDFANLASVLGVPKKLSTQNPDNLPSFSICYCVQETSAPTDFFICFTLFNENDGAQLGVGGNKLFYYRFKTNRVWGSWKTVSGT